LKGLSTAPLRMVLHSSSMASASSIYQSFNLVMKWMDFLPRSLGILSLRVGVLNPRARVVDGILGLFARVGDGGLEGPGSGVGVGARGLQSLWTGALPPGCSSDSIKVVVPSVFSIVDDGLNRPLKLLYPGRQCPVSYSGEDPPRRTPLFCDLGQMVAG